MSFSTFVGSLGVGILLLAFFLSIFHLLKPSGKLYLVMNIVGAALSCYASYLIDYVPFVILEATWGAVALVGLIRLISTNKQPAQR